MLNAQEVVKEINKLVQEATDGTGHWTNEDILIRANMFQDELNLDIPDLFIVVDESLVTIAGTRLYTMPATVGLPITVKVNGKPIIKSSYAGLDSLSLSGQIDAQWQTYQGNEAEYWYLENGKVGIYPTPASNGAVITIVAELMLTALTDAQTSYPFENTAYLKVAQRWLILKTASMCASEDGDADNPKATTWDNQAEILVNKIKDKISIMRGVATDINAVQQTEGEEE